jgi:hypothetical protein
LGVPGRCGGGRRGALYPLADCLPDLCHPRRYAFGSSDEVSFMSSSVRRFCPRTATFVPRR